LNECRNKLKSFSFSKKRNKGIGEDGILFVVTKGIKLIFKALFPYFKIHKTCGKSKIHFSQAKTNFICHRKMN